MRQLARDLAIVGGVSALAAPGAFMLYRPHLAYFEVVVIAGILSGPLVALLYLRAVGDPRQRPAVMLSAVGALLGLLWGAAVGAAGGLAERQFFEWSVLLAALSAGLQLGLFGPALARRAADGRRSWPVLLGAAAVAPVAGNAAYLLVCALGRWLQFF